MELDVKGFGLSCCSQGPGGSSHCRHLDFCQHRLVVVTSTQNQACKKHNMVRWGLGTQERRSWTPSGTHSRCSWTLGAPTSATHGRSEHRASALALVPESSRSRLHEREL